MSTSRNRFLTALLFALLAMAAIGRPAGAATWSTVPTLAPEGFSESALADVSCTSTAFCVAVGTADDGGEETSAHIGAFSEVWDGSSWTAVPTADAAGAGGALVSVSCVSPSFCVAVGAIHSEGLLYLGETRWDVGRALVETWNGSMWSIVPTPAGETADSILNGVSCVSTSFCVAVGSRETGGGSIGTAMVEVWNGSRWKQHGTPSPKRGWGSQLLGVSCAGHDTCTAVGTYGSDGLGFSWRGTALAERWNGRRWSVERPPVGRLESGESGEGLNSVDCKGRSACLAVGGFFSTSGASVPLAEARRAGRWRRITSGLPKYGRLESVSCIGVNRCVAVGQLDSAFWLTSDRPKPLILNWDGSRWTRELAPSGPSSANKFLNQGLISPSLFGISCPAGGGCTVVAAQPSAGAGSPLVQSTTETFAEPTPALPAPRITAAPGATTTARSARLEFGSGAAGASFECRLGGEGVGAALSHWSPCTSPRIYTHLAPGQKRFSVRVAVGSERSAATTREWTILRPGAPKPLVLPVVGGRASFHATCPLAERCHERVVVKAGGKELARGSYSIPAHADRHVEIGLTGTGERLLAHRSQVAATLVLENLRTHKRAEVAVLLERR